MLKPDIDNMFNRVMAKVFDLIWLNVLTVLCSLPIITLGASLTAMNYVLLKLKRDEGESVTKAFFHSFRTNLKQGIGLGMFGVLGALADIRLFMIIREGKSDSSVYVGAFTLLLFLVFFFEWAFPLLSHFKNTVGGTAINAFKLMLGQSWRTLVMSGMWISMLFMFAILWRWIFMLFFIFFFTAPGFGCQFLVDPVFCKLEGNVSEAQTEISVSDRI
jgi:uncharacterized membrane protein YesL